MAQARELLTPDGVLEAALYVDDLDRAEAFYTGVMGLSKLARLDGRHVFFRCGGTIVLVFLADATRVRPPTGALPVPAHGAVGAGHVCFSVERQMMDRWRHHLEEAVVAVEADFLWPNGARSIYVRDPSGNSIELAEPALWDEP